MPLRNVPTVQGKEPRPGLRGLILDRIDFVKLAFKDYMNTAEERRKSYEKVGKNIAPVKYETRTKAPADKKARQAGLVEKLK